MADKIEWTPEMIDYLKEENLTTQDRVMVRKLGVGMTTIKKKRRELGLTKPYKRQARKIPVL